MNTTPPQTTKAALVCPGAPPRQQPPTIFLPQTQDNTPCPENMQPMQPLTILQPGFVPQSKSYRFRVRSPVIKSHRRHPRPEMYASRPRSQNSRPQMPIPPNNASSITIQYRTYFVHASLNHQQVINPVVVQFDDRITYGELLTILKIEKQVLHNNSGSFLQLIMAGPMQDDLKRWYDVPFSSMSIGSTSWNGIWFYFNTDNTNGGSDTSDSDNEFTDNHSTDHHAMDNDDPTENDPTDNDPTENNPTKNDPTNNDPTNNDHPTDNHPPDDKQYLQKKQQCYECGTYGHHVENCHAVRVIESLQL